jgi:creatinine amidohydrolase
MDTSEMIYLGGDRGWVRMSLLPTALGDPEAGGGQASDPKAPHLNNGITGDARRSTAQLGKKFIDMKVDYAVRQINQLLAAKPTSGAQ